MHKSLIIIVLWIFIAFLASPGALAEDFEMTATPDDLYTYIQELHARKYDDTLLDKAALFLKRYPDHTYAEPVRQIQIAVLNRHQRHAETLEAIRQYLEKFPNSPQREAYRRLEGACHYSQKNFAAAAECFLEVSQNAKAEEVREDATLALAQCHQVLKQTADATRLYQTLVALPLADGRPARLQARVQYINILQNENNHREALRLCQELLAFKPTPADLRQALLYQAANLALRIGEDLPLAEQLYAAFLVEAPRHPAANAALRQLCVCKFRLKKFEEFLELAARYRAQLPPGTEDPQLDFDTVEALMSLQRHAEALPVLRKIIEAPQNSEELLRKARYYEFTALATLQKDAEVLERGDAFLADYPNFPYKTAILRQLVVTSAQDPAARQRTRAYLESLLPLLTGDREATEQYGFLLAQHYEAEQLWNLAADLLEKLARDADPAQRATFLMRAAQNANLLPDFERARRLLDAARAIPELPAEQFVMASELLYRFADEANQPQVAAQTAREALEKATARERTVWLTRLGNHFLQANQYDQAANCYGQALATPEMPADARCKLLPTQVQLLMVTKRSDELFELLPEFYAQPALPLRPQVCEDLANYCADAKRHDFAHAAWERLLLNSEITAEQERRAVIRLAELELDAQPKDAQQRLQTLLADCERLGVPAPADAYAILAEIHLRAKEYDLTLMNVDRALEKERPAIFETRTATRAWWVKAQFLYECRHDLAAAKSTASLAGLLKTDQTYSPRALQLIVQILREQHQDHDADEEERRLRQKFPDFLKPENAPQK